MSDSILDGNPDATAKELAVYFTARSGESAGGSRYITDKQINAWYKHRPRNGFPLEEEEKRKVRGARPARVWNVARAWEWFRDYVPSKGGAPSGNRNAVRHGRCVGLRAARDARTEARARSERVRLSEEDEREVSRLEDARRYWENRLKGDTSCGAQLSARDVNNERDELLANLGLCREPGCRNHREQGELCPECETKNALTKC